MPLHVFVQLLGCCRGLQVIAWEAQIRQTLIHTALLHILISLLVQDISLTIMPRTACCTLFFIAPFKLHRPTSVHLSSDRTSKRPLRCPQHNILRLAHACIGDQDTPAHHSYVLAPQRISPGDFLQSGPSAEIRPGNALPLSAIPIGQAIHNVELYPGKGGQMARAAGTVATLVSKGVISSCRKRQADSQSFVWRACASLHTGCGSREEGV